MRYSNSFFLLSVIAFAVHLFNEFKAFLRETKERKIV